MKSLSAIWVSSGTPDMDTVGLLQDAFQRVELAEPKAIPDLAGDPLVLFAEDDGGEGARAFLASNLAH